MATGSARRGTALHPHFLFETSKRKRLCTVKRKDVWRTFEAQGSSVLKTGAFSASAWQKISGPERSAAMSLSKVELPIPLNNCPTILVLTSFSFREYSLRSRRCCGECRRAGRPRPAVYGCAAVRRMFPKEWGVHSGDQRSPLSVPSGEEHKKICSRPMVLGRERTYASWCHPNSRQIVSLGLLLRGGSRGRFRPRSAAVLRLIRTGNFQPGFPLCGSVVRVLLRHLRGGFSTILCDFQTDVKGKTAIRYGNPGRPGPGPAPAFRRWRCCWRRECCCGRTGGKYSLLPC